MWVQRVREKFTLVIKYKKCQGKSVGYTTQSTHYGQWPLSPYVLGLHITCHLEGLFVVWNGLNEGQEWGSIVNPSLVSSITGELRIITPWCENLVNTGQPHVHVYVVFGRIQLCWGNDTEIVCYPQTFKTSGRTWILKLHVSFLFQTSSNLFLITVW